MNKKEILQRIIAQLSYDLDVLFSAAKTAQKVFRSGNSQEEVIYVKGKRTTHCPDTYKLITLQRRGDYWYTAR
jgi:hypothetical protein